MFANFFRSLMGKNQFPNTEIFRGSSYSGTSYGGIGMDAEKDASKAKIIFTDKKHHNKIARLEVFPLDQLKKTSLYQSSVEDRKPERLVNTWISRRNKNTIIKTAGEGQLAFAFTSPSEVENDLTKLIDFRRIDYFNELAFCSFLKNTLNMSIDQLRMVPGMDNRRINLLLKQHSAFENLISYGFTIEQLGIMDEVLLNLFMGERGNSEKLKQLEDFGITPAQILLIDYARLKNIFSQPYYYLSDALNFVTIEQILGLDSKPLPLTEIKKTGQSSTQFIGSSSGGRFGDYIYKSNCSLNKSTVKITHEKKAGAFEAISGTLNEESLVKFDKIIKNLDPTKLIHDWYIIDAGDKQRIIYCPELKNMIHEIHQLEVVPKEYLELQMFDFHFYKEKKFAEFLRDQGCPIDHFRTLPGMSQQKLQLLSENRHVMEELIAKGIKIEEFASINDLRLEHVITNYSKLNNALKIVSISQIVDLPSASSKESLEEPKSKRMRLA